MTGLRLSRYADYISRNALLSFSSAAMIILVFSAGSVNARSVRAPITYTDMGPRLSIPMATRPGVKNITPASGNNSRTTTPEAFKFITTHPTHEGTRPVQTAAVSGILSVAPGVRPSSPQFWSFSDRHLVIMLLALAFATITVAIQRSARHLRAILITTQAHPQRGRKRR